MVGAIREQYGHWNSVNSTIVSFGFLVLPKTGLSSSGMSQTLLSASISARACSREMPRLSRAYLMISNSSLTCLKSFSRLSRRACWLNEPPAEAWLQATRLETTRAIAKRERRFILVLWVKTWGHNQPTMCEKYNNENLLWFEKNIKNAYTIVSSVSIENNCKIWFFDNFPQIGIRNYKQFNKLQK